MSLNEERPTTEPPIVLVIPVNWELISSICNTLLVLFKMYDFSAIPCGKYTLSTEPSSNISSSYTIEKLFFV